MKTAEVSIRVFNTRIAAETAAQLMRKAGFVVAELMEVTDTVSWDNRAIANVITGNDNDASPATGQSLWLVVGHRP